MNQSAAPAPGVVPAAATAPMPGAASTSATTATTQPAAGTLPRPLAGTVSVLPRRPGYADGGVVMREDQRGGLRGLADRIQQIPVGGYPQAPAADGSQDRWSNTETGRNLSNIAAALPGSFGNVVPAVARTGGAISAGIDKAVRVVGGTAAGATLGTAATSPAVAAAPAPSSAGAGRGSVNPPMVNPNAPLPVQAAQAQPAPGEAFSDTPAPVAAPGRVSAQERLMALATGQAAETPAVRPPTLRHSGNDWQARKNLENAQTAASSIMNTRQWGGQGAENNPAILTYRAALANDKALQQAQPGLEQEGMRQTGLWARERLLQTSANVRAGLAADRQDKTNAIAAGELGLKQAAAGYQNRAAQRVENAQVAYEEARTPAQRVSARDRLFALMGKARDDHWKAIALQGGTDAAGNRTESVLGAVNQSTGEMKRLLVAPNTLPHQAALVRGQSYQTSKGAATWDGERFHLMSK